MLSSLDLIQAHNLEYFLFLDVRVDVNFVAAIIGAGVFFLVVATIVFFVAIVLVFIHHDDLLRVNQDEKRFLGFQLSCKLDIYSWYFSKEHGSLREESIEVTETNKCLPNVILVFDLCKKDTDDEKL